MRYIVGFTLSLLLSTDKCLALTDGYGVSRPSDRGIHWTELGGTGNQDHEGTK